MDDHTNIVKPKHIETIVARASQIGFDATCDNLTGNADFQVLGKGNLCQNLASSWECL